MESHDLPLTIADGEVVLRVLRDPQGFYSRRRKHVGEPFRRGDISPMQLFRPHRSEHDSSLIRQSIGAGGVALHAKDVPNAIALVPFTAGDARAIPYDDRQALDVEDDRSVYLGHANLTLPCISPEEFPEPGRTMSEGLRRKLKSIYDDLFDRCGDVIPLDRQTPAGEDV
ncbi:hypothetical protein Uis1B_2223 [Bifidobacterium margollesii]|uniref:Uncharacterized protein n=1 Tax=Bifidobacterium margollesii TaxID=2020964 RepID=A0A2N5J6W3_9BIFI|nr:hypothetical protein [Bifidobacterium margollesii]PLS29955.1 hypothetical protein Uis1B_2223 [Bifidobacterium margollesii]